MQYLEPAHRLVFGNGIVYWEFFFGARSWLVPGFVAAILAALNAVGLGEPAWYIGGVKLAFCAISLAVPAGMYVFGRRHFGEAAARVALLAGAFWYELIGFAHKPMTEFVATGLFVLLLAASVRPHGIRFSWLPAMLAVAAIRPQYAPLALVLLALVFVRSDRRIALVALSAAFAFAVAIFDGATWDGRMLHSYITNFRYNVLVEGMRAGESASWQYAAWLTAASAGLAAATFLAALVNARRYALLLSLAAIVVVLHSLQAHKEYRFVFVLVPLWLLIGSDLAVGFASAVSRPNLARGAVGLVAGAVAVGGLLNALPFQGSLYQAWSRETGAVRFVRDQDPVFAAYRHLAGDPSVRSIWHVDRYYFNTPGYFYLHSPIPFYDARSGPVLLAETPLQQAVTHLVTENADLAPPGYVEERRFGPVRILRRPSPTNAVRRWEEYAPVMTNRFHPTVMRRLNRDAPTPPPDFGVRFVSDAAAQPIPNRSRR